MKIDLASFLPCAYEEAVRRAKTPRLLENVAAPIVKFSPDEPSSFPREWAEGTYHVRLKLFGLIPFGKQAIVITYPDTAGAFSLRDNGYSYFIPTWDHIITITPLAQGVLYRDMVTIEAGVFTPAVWAFAYLFYLHRQRRWKRLAAEGFAAIA